MAQITAVSGEARLIAAAQAGDERALDALIAEYLPRIRRFALGVCAEEEDANDVAQDTVLTAVRSLSGFRGNSSFATWLFTIARRFCIRNRRRDKIAANTAIDGVAEASLRTFTPTPEDNLARNEIQAAIDAAIVALPRSYREVVLLRDVEGLSAHEAAETLGVSVQTVKTRLHRARTTLRMKLAPALGNDAVHEESVRCRKALKFFSPHEEGDLTPSQCAEMEKHLLACPNCRDTCEALRRTLAMCRESSAPAVPRALERAIRLRIQTLIQS